MQRSDGYHVQMVQIQLVFSDWTSRVAPYHFLQRVVQEDRIWCLSWHAKERSQMRNTMRRHVAEGRSLLGKPPSFYEYAHTKSRRKCPEDSWPRRGVVSSGLLSSGYSSGHVLTWNCSGPISRTATEESHVFPRNSAHSSGQRLGSHCQQDLLGSEGLCQRLTRLTLPSLTIYRALSP